MKKAQFYNLKSLINLTITIIIIVAIAIPLYYSSKREARIHVLQTIASAIKTKVISVSHTAKIYGLTNRMIIGDHVIKLVTFNHIPATLTYLFTAPKNIIVSDYDNNTFYYVGRPNCKVTYNPIAGNTSLSINYASNPYAANPNDNLFVITDKGC